jgi:hypothetical protein
MSERKEAFMRIAVLIVSGIILAVWKGLNQILILVNWIITLIAGKRNRGIANFCEIWNTQAYMFLRYISMVTNERPFPFTHMAKNMTKFSR